MFSLVPCPTLLNTVPTHSAPGETQRVATKHVFHQHPLRDDVCNDAISMECPPPVDACSQRATRRDNAHQRHPRSVQSSRRALNAASSHKPNQDPYTACNPSASYSRGVVCILCPVVVVAPPLRHPNRNSLLFSVSIRRVVRAPLNQRSSTCPGW